MIRQLMFLLFATASLSQLANAREAGFSHKLPTRSAPPSSARIENLKLLNPLLAPGERLDLRANIKPGKYPLILEGASGIWLGLVKNNIFANSSAIGRDLRSLGGDLYQSTNLQVNPWVANTLPDFTIMQFFVYDQNGDVALLQSYGFDDEFYHDQFGELTSIPVIHFKLKQNQKADFAAPRVLEVTSSKTVYAPQEPLQLNFVAEDALSGINTEGMSAMIATLPQAFPSGMSVIGKIREVSQKHFEIDGIRFQKMSPNGMYVLRSFSVADRAGNWDTLQIIKPDDEFYIRTGQPTSIRVIRFEIKGGTNLPIRNRVNPRNRTGQSKPGRF